MLMANTDPGRMGAWSLALLLAWGASAIILFASTWLYKLLGMRVLIAMERLMGMLLVAISVQMIIDGAGVYLAGL
jgi:small neutral amino acid transporter SnatA (MarC family)